MNCAPIDQKMSETRDLEKRLAKNCEEAIGEAVDALWASKGRLVWISQKQRFCSQYVCPSDLEDIRNAVKKLNAKAEALKECVDQLLKYNAFTKQNKFEDYLKRADIVLKRIITLRQYLDKLVEQVRETLDKSEEKNQREKTKSKDGKL